MVVIDFIQGFIIGSTLIIAIGPQNLFVINQGLKKQFIFTVVLFCSLSDSVLIIIGIKLSNLITNINPYTITILKIIGGVWLTLYGTNKIVKLNKLKNLNIDKNKEENIKKILITLFIITYINPHVYLDTVILIGSISSNFENKLLFGLGAIISSFVFFFCLGYLSKFLSYYVYSQKTWFWIDLIVGLLMIIYGFYFIFF
tara:strand:+ start:1706 stop:2305 length:600 start_codon:yes stop_codon:yes gene_type:complete